MQAIPYQHWRGLSLQVAIAFSYAAAFVLRFDFSLPEPMRAVFVLGSLLFVLPKILVFHAFRVNASQWRFAGLHDVCRILAANLAASGLAVVVSMTAGVRIPASVYWIDFALCCLATAGVQLSVRLYWEVFDPTVNPRRESKTIIIYGAGAAGLMLAKEIRTNARLGTSVVGFLDDDPDKLGGLLIGLPVLGAGCDAARIVEGFKNQQRPISEIVIAIRSATAMETRAVYRSCRAAGIPFRALPGLSESLNGKITPQIRDVSANDLLGRAPVRIDEDYIGRSIAGESVLVTGGCGSIGAELCRQIASYNPRKLVIFDQAESEMFMLAMDLRKRYPSLVLATEVGDIFRAQRVKSVMALHGVGSVFHAAAYKHVPLMEDHVTEAIENNVMGTYNVARAAHAHGVKTFVLISSDKAVNPTSVMGLTKRVAELIVSAMPLDSSPCSGAFVSVRFGNVLGSSGSVIPIFRRQIASGGPVTVTHPDMRRYFMSISEAVQLVLQASAIGQGSEVFVLDMGEPVRIMDLAENMIRLAGLVPGEDIEIRLTGMRPGEKLFEELRLEGEDILPTTHEKIRRFRSPSPDRRQVALWLDRLRVLLVEGNEEVLKRHLARLVPEYQAVPQHEVHADNLVEVTAP